jgi:hypothetical protein
MGTPGQPQAYEIQGIENGQFIKMCPKYGLKKGLKEIIWQICNFSNLINLFSLKKRKMKQMIRKNGRLNKS